MEELLIYILSKVVSDPSQLKITSETKENGEIVYFINIPEIERGIVIGKKGKNIQALRDIVSIIARREGKKVWIKIAD